MKKARRFLSLLLSIAMVATVAGCGASDGASSAAASTPTGSQSAASSDASVAANPSTDKTVVEFWHSMSGKNGELIDQMAKDFNAANPGIEVVPTFQGGYWEAAAKAQAAVSAGENPDILMMGADHVSIFAQEDGLLADLKPYLQKSGIDDKDFVEAFSWDYYVNDKLIALPFGRSTPIMYVNNEILKKAGQSIPTTWEELESVSNAIVKSGAAEYGFTIPGNDTWYWFMAVAQAGGRFINSEQTGLGGIEDGTMQTAFTYYQNLSKSGAMYFGPVTDSNTTCRQMFLDGKAAMFITSVGNMSAIKEAATFDWQTAFVPKGKVQVVPTGGCSVVLMEASPNKEAAWKFMEWVIKDPKGGLAFVLGTGYLPYTYSMTETEEIKNLWATNKNAETAFKQLEFASDKGHRVPQIGAILNEILSCVEAVMYDQEDVKTQLDILDKSVKDILSK